MNPRKTCLLLLLSLLGAAAADSERFGFRLLATSKTSTMEKEMNEAAEAGYVFASVMGGESAFGGKEVVVVMARDMSAEKPASRRYKLLAASKTSTLEKEMRAAGQEGFEYRGQTVFESAFGGREVSVILERDLSRPSTSYDYRLLATSKTSTMEKELQEAGQAGYTVAGMSVGKTAFGGSEVVCVMKKVMR